MYDPLDELCDALEALVKQVARLDRLPKAESHLSHGVFWASWRATEYAFTLGIWAASAQNDVEERVQEGLVQGDVALAEWDNLVRQAKQVDLKILFNAILEENLFDHFIKDLY